MSNPYIQPSLTGYNASPPSDDGSTTSGNQLKWSNHKTKLGDPLKTFIENVDAATLAAFGLSFGAGIAPKTSAYTVTTADRGRFITVTGTTTITLLAAATAGAGFPLLVVNIGTGTVTVDGNGSETINGAATQTLQPGESLIISSDSVNWYGIANNVTQTLSAYKTANEPRSSDDTPGIDADLIVPVRANIWYRFEQVISISSSSSTPDFRCAWNVPAGTITGNFQQHAIESTSGNQDVQTGNWTATPIISLTGGNLTMVVFKGIFLSNVAGNVQFTWSQNVSDATATNLNAGSYLLMEPM